MTRTLYIFLSFICLVACSVAPSAEGYKTVKIAGGLEFPWGMAFLPSGDILVTEREGRLRIIRKGVLDASPIAGLPENIFVSGQGGLLDVSVHPNFKDNQLIYISYAGQNQDGAGTEVARGRLEGNELKDLEIIFKVSPKTAGAHHYGSRLLFLPDNTLLITTGDRYFMMKEAQNLDNHLGTVIRINDDGSIPEDNPFVKKEQAQPEIYSYGHRNIQGIALRPSDQAIWMHEHGPKGGDEVNIIRAGLNYGWPEITYGIDYSGAIISDKTAAPEMEQPVIYWTPSIAPCGMAFYDGDKFPEWQGDLFVGALAGTHLRRLELEGNEVVEQEVLLEDYGRIRDVENGPDGYLYILIDDLDGSLVKLEPTS